MRFYISLLATAGVLLGSVAAWAQTNTETLPPLCTAATLTTCVPQRVGVVARIKDGASSTVCTGGGSTEVACIYNGSGWNVTDSAGIWIGASGESLVNATDGTFDFTRDEAGTVTITASDNDSTAAMTVLPGGAAAMVIGGATTTSVTINTDGADWNVDTLNTNTASLVGSANDSVIFDYRDYGSTANDDMAHVTLVGNCTTAAASTEDCDFAIGVVENGSAAETRFLIDADDGVDIGSANTNNVTVVTDGGTITMDGYVQGLYAPATELAGGTLTVNTVHIATAAADYDLPDSCDTATGNWVTLIVQDASEVVSLTVLAAEDEIKVGGVNAAANEEIDSSGTVAGDGDSITVACLQANVWYSVAQSGTWVDGGAAD